MIQMITAYTEEVDEVEIGLAEIMGQINTGSLKKYSVGIVTCHADFTESGFVGELCKKLPFDIIGMTTLASANKYGQSMYALSLTVLTSDEVIFETAATSSLGPENYRGEIETVYSETVKKLPGRPSFILPFFPYIQEVSGSTIIKCFDEICGGIPFWGSLATNIDVSYEHCYAFRNDNIEKGGLAMILMHGPVDPEFIVVSLPTRNIRRERGRITSSDGCLLREINGIPPLEYFETLGVTIMKDASIVTPLMVYYEGSSEPVALGMYVVNDDGSVQCAGEMTVGATVAIGEITNEGILASTSEGMDRILKSGRRDGALILPCVSRYVMLINHDDELNLITDKMKNNTPIPYMIGYSGGELCPVRDEDGVYRNRFHNYTFSACVL